MLYRHLAFILLEASRCGGEGRRCREACMNFTTYDSKDDVTNGAETVARVSHCLAGVLFVDDLTIIKFTFATTISLCCHVLTVPLLTTTDVGRGPDEGSISVAVRTHAYTRHTSRQSIIGRFRENSLGATTATGIALETWSVLYQSLIDRLIDRVITATITHKVCGT
jgi:hypothetical protein